MSTNEETAAAISGGDLHRASNQIETEFTRTFSGVFAPYRTWRKAAGHADVLTAGDTPVTTGWDLAETAGYDTSGPFPSLIAENKWDHDESGHRIAAYAPQWLPCPADDPPARVLLWTRLPH